MLSEKSMNLIILFIENTTDSRVTLSPDECQRFLVEQKMFQQTHVIFIKTLLTQHESEIEMAYKISKNMVEKCVHTINLILRV